MCYNFFFDSKDSQVISCIDYYLRKKFILGLNLGYDNFNFKCFGDNKIDVFFLFFIDKIMNLLVVLIINLLILFLYINILCN